MPNYVVHENQFVPVSYTVSEIDNMMKIIPVSRYGDATADPIPFSIVGGKLQIAAVPTFLSGKGFNMGVTTISTDTTPNKTWYLYFALSEGAPVYRISATVLDETITQMYIGKIVTDGSGQVQSSNVTLEKVTRIDIYRLSATRRGTAIPVSTGDVTGTGTYQW